MATAKKALNHLVFLDAATVDYGDLPLDVFGRFGPLRLHPLTAPQDIETRAREATLILTTKCVFDRALLSRLKKLRYIGLAATGSNNIDLKAAREFGIAVTNVAGYSTETVVQCTFSFLLALAGNLVKFNEAAHKGLWSRSPVFTYAAYPVAEIRGKTLGIIGYGSIGRRVAEIARAFGMKVLVVKIPGRSYGRDRIPRVSLDALFRQSDFVTLHAPLTDLTRHLVNEKTLAKFKKGACLINMARGALVEENSLAKALRSGRLAGAAADVLTQEPPPADLPLLKAPNLLLTPHIAWASLEARRRLVREMMTNVESFLKGKRRNRVD